jgi:hypothetical protein
MALAHVQDSSSVVVSSGNPSTALITFGSAIAAGSTLVVLISQAATGARTYVVSDSIHGTTGWTKAIGVTTGVTNQIWYRGNHNGGTVTITVTHNDAATPLFLTAACELSGYGSTVTVEATDSLTEAGVLNTHTCSTAGVSSSNECFAFCAGNLTSASTDCSPGTGYTEITPGYAQGQFLLQRRYFASGCTNEVGTWTNTGTARIGRSAIALLSGPAGVGGGGGGSSIENLLLLGVG